MTLLEYLTAISKNPELGEKLRKYPAYALKDVHLSNPAEKQALLSGDWQRITQMLGGGDDVPIYFVKVSMRLKDFVLGLAQDLERDGALLAAFQADPAAFLAPYDLPAPCKELICANDSSGLQRLLGDAPLPNVFSSRSSKPQGSKE